MFGLLAGFSRGGQREAPWAGVCVCGGDTEFYTRCREGGKVAGAAWRVDPILVT